MEAYQKFCNYYDLIYPEDKYEKETRLITSIFNSYADHKVKSVLDAGCGTGRHAWKLAALGYEVVGFDLSSGMVEKAKEQRVNIPNSPKFYIGDARNIDLQRKFDCIISLFNVLSYHITNNDIHQFFVNLKKHLNPGGILCAEFWSGYGVISLGKMESKKVFKREDIIIERSSSAVIDFKEQKANLKYDFVVYDKKGTKIEEFEEIHLHRYFFPNEIKLLAEKEGLKVVKLSSSMDKLDNIDLNSLYGFVILKG